MSRMRREGLLDSMSQRSGFPQVGRTARYAMFSVFALAGCSSAAGDGPADGEGGGLTAQAGGAGAVAVGGGGSGSVAGSGAVAGAASAAGAGGGDVSAGGASGGASAGGVSAGGVSAGGASVTSGGTSGGVSGSAGSAGAGTPLHPTCAPGIPSSVADLASSTSQSTVSKITPMGTRYDTPSKHTMTSDDLAFLHDASKQPPIPGSTSGLHLKAMPVTLYPSGAGLPTPADVNQHAIGNCDGDTALASMAYSNAPFVKSLITDNGNSTYTVAMYDPMGKRITVTLDNQFLVDSQNKLGAASGKKGEADWATVLEKATMKYVKVFPVVADIGGIGSEHQTPMFTGAGGSFAFDRGKLKPADLTRVVKAALAAGKLISGGFGIDGKALASGLQTVTAHGYAVFVPKNASTMISMRNPWGLDPTDHGYDASTDGVLDIPVDASWASTIDLRIIDPGDACSAGVTLPYLPLAGDISAKSLDLSDVYVR